jgi:large subunit ribosomal protein L17
MRGTPTKGKRFGGDSAHQKAMMGNLVASMIAAESIVTTEAKAKALRPIVEKVVTAAKNSPEGSVHANRRVVAFIRDKDMTHKAVHRDRAALHRSPRWLHADPEARAAPR